jgi:DNA polymerase-3 subunit gamma/tau
MVPRGLAPASIARGFRQRFGQPPRRDPSRRACRAYSMRELGASLGALGLAFPADPLAELWAAALDRVELPSSRMLLSQQARLLRLDERRAVVAVAHPWGAMAQARLPLLEQALADAIGSPRVVVLELLPEGVAR